MENNIQEWEFAMSGDELESLVGYAKQIALDISVLADGVSDEAQYDSDITELEEIKYKIFEDKNKTSQQWELEIAELVNKISEKYSLDYKIKI